jgi:hypothetical protein
MNKFFSKAQIAKLESLIKELANELCDKIIRLGMLRLRQKSWPRCGFCADGDRNKCWEAI